MTNRTIITALAALAIAGCGGFSKSPEDQVMAAEVNGIEALLSDHPERSCQYVTDHDKCINSILTAKAMDLEIRSVVGVPDDWRARLKKAKVVIKGDRATLAPGPRGKTITFIRRGGHWLIEN